MSNLTVATEIARSQGRDYAQPRPILDLVDHLDTALPAAGDVANQPEVHAVAIAYCDGVADVLAGKVATRIPTIGPKEADQVVASIEAAIEARWSHQAINELPSHALDITLAWLVRDTLRKDGVKSTPETFAARLERLRVVALGAPAGLQQPAEDR